MKYHNIKEIEKYVIDRFLQLPYVKDIYVIDRLHVPLYRIFLTQDSSDMANRLSEVQSELMDWLFDYYFEITYCTLDEIYTKEVN